MSYQTLAPSATIPLDPHPTPDWASWSRELWSRAESSWIERDGQDHFYRDNVVLPAIRQILSKPPGRPYRSLVDIGAGDSYCTSILVNEPALSQLKTVLLIDQSACLLSKATIGKPGLEVKTLVADLTVPESWTSALKLDEPRLLTSIFVLQEMLSIGKFFVGLENTLGIFDKMLFVIVDPAYSQFLRDKGDIIVRGSGSSSDDWQWAGEYPITVPGSTIYLPHFQRSRQAIETIVEKSHLRMTEWLPLSVPESREAKGVFKDTVYGEEILQMNSSVLFAVERETRK